MENSLPGDTQRTIVVAGGTGALGASVTRAFLAGGETVVVTYRNREEYDRLRASVGAVAQLSGQQLDATDQAAASALVATVVRQHGSLDALVVTIGGYLGGKRLWESDATAYDTMLDLNLRASWTMARAAVPVMIEQNRGWLVNVASRAAYERAGGAALYAASKAAALALWEALAEEVKPFHINVNSVVPSIMDTPANRRAMAQANFEQWPKTEDVARVIVFLCSDQARVIHGAAIPVYGHS
jgi:NAD(P)-dependent dehydrogenase (short-subunit alcohol dehydrogenase family)